MIDYQDFIYTYSTVSVQMLIVFYFFTKFLKKKIGTLYYLLFTLFGTMIIMGIQAGNIVCFLVCVLLLIIGGVFVCKVDGISAVLYAIITVEIMQFCYIKINDVEIPFKINSNKNYKNFILFIIS